MFYHFICIKALYSDDMAGTKQTAGFPISFFNNYFTFTLSADFLDTLGAIIGIYIIENTIKTFLFYTNISKNHFQKPICITLSVIMILTYIVFFFLLIILDM